MIRADPGLRRQTFVVLGVAALLAITAVFAFQHWLTGVADSAGTELLILRLRQLIGIAVIGSALCLAFLAWYAARKAAQITKYKQWPLPGVRVLRDTPVRRGVDAMKVRLGLNVVTGVLMLLALAAGFVGWRLLSLS